MANTAGNDLDEKLAGSGNRHILYHKRLTEPAHDRRHHRLCAHNAGVLAFSLLPSIVGEKLPTHPDFDPVSFGIGNLFDAHVEVDSTHDAVATLFLNQRL